MFLVWADTNKSLEQFIKSINGLHPHINFTAEFSTVEIMSIKFQSNPSYCQLHCSATKMTSVSETTHTLRYELGRFTSRSQSPPRRYNPQVQDEIISSIQETLVPNNLHQYTGLSLEILTCRNFWYQCIHPLAFWHHFFPQRSPRIRWRHNLHNYASFALINRSYDVHSSVGAPPPDSPIPPNARLVDVW